MLLQCFTRVHSGSLCGVNMLMCPLMSSYCHSPDKNLDSLLHGLEGLPKLQVPVPVVVVSVSQGGLVSH